MFLLQPVTQADTGRMFHFSKLYSYISQRRVVPLQTITAQLLRIGIFFFQPRGLQWGVQGPYRGPVLTLSPWTVLWKDPCDIIYQFLKQFWGSLSKVAILKIGQALYLLSNSQKISSPQPLIGRNHAHTFF